MDMITLGTQQFINLEFFLAQQQAPMVYWYQVQAVYMYGAAQPDFLKSETNGGIKNIISHHLKIIKRCIFSPNLEGVAQKISLPRPWEV